MARPHNPPIDAERLRRERDRLGLTVRDLADRASKLGRKVSRQAVASWELGYFSPAPELLEQLAQVLGVPTSELLLPAGSKPPQGPPSRQAGAR